jgi:cytoskeleton protein RodZ
MSLGSELSAAREEAGLTLEQVADRTRIRRTVIERIEADDFSLCGGDVYARGHVRTLAKVCGIDPVPLVEEFDTLHAAQPPSATEVFDADTWVARERRGPNWTAAMATAVVILLAVAAFQLLRPPPGGTTGGLSTPPTAAPPATTSAPAPTATATPSGSPTLIAKVPPSAQGVTVRLSVTTGKSWVSVTAGSGKLFEGLVSAGAVKVFTDPNQVKVVIGNAGVVRLVVNGVDIGAAGGAGQVVRLTFGPGDPTQSG